MKPKFCFCLIVMAVFSVGCSEMDFDPQLSQAGESPSYGSPRVPPPAPPHEEKLEKAEPLTPQKAPEAPNANPIQPAPAPVTPNSDKTPKDTAESLLAPQPAALPEIQKNPLPSEKSRENKIPQENKESQESKENTLKLISDDPDKNLEVLNMALESWITEKGTLPDRLEQLVMEEYLPMLPMEPIGKRFAIDTDKRTVILVGQ